MSIHGTHCTMTKAEAKAQLPPGACVDCVYHFRMAHALGRQDLADYGCSRCNVNPWGRLWFTNQNVMRHIMLNRRYFIASPDGKRLNTPPQCLWRAAG